jgi:hypothetical protein
MIKELRNLIWQGIIKILRGECDLISTLDVFILVKENIIIEAQQKFAITVYIRWRRNNGR